MIGGVRGGEGVEEGGRGEWLPWEQGGEWGWGWGWEEEGWEEGVVLLFMVSLCLTFLRSEFQPLPGHRDSCGGW